MTLKEFIDKITEGIEPEDFPLFEVNIYTSLTTIATIKSIQIQPRSKYVDIELKSDV